MSDGELLHRLDRLLGEIRSEHELNRQQYRELHEITMREIRLNRAAFQDSRTVTRELIVQLREDRDVLADIRQSIQANTEGLLRVLDELRRGDGPSPASA